jgi:hypothetical protein
MTINNGLTIGPFTRTEATVWSIHATVIEVPYVIPSHIKCAPLLRAWTQTPLWSGCKKRALCVDSPTTGDDHKAICEEPTVCLEGVLVYFVPLDPTEGSVKNSNSGDVKAGSKDCL